VILWKRICHKQPIRILQFSNLKNKNKKQSIFFPSPKYNTLKCLPLKLNLHSFNAFHPFSLPHFVVFSSETMITLNLSFSFIGGHSVTNHLLFPPDLKTILYPSHKKTSPIFYPFISTKSKLPYYHIIFGWWKYLSIER